MENETLFSALVKTRIAMCELMELGLMRDDHIDYFEQQILSQVGIDYMVYANWKNWLIVNKKTAGQQLLLLFTEKVRVVRCSTLTFYVFDPTGTSFLAGIFFETCNRKVGFDNAWLKGTAYRLDFGTPIKTDFRITNWWFTNEWLQWISSV